MKQSAYLIQQRETRRRLVQAAERDIYRRLYEGLLDRMRMERRETA